MSFLVTQNIERFERLLAGALLQDQRAMVQKLLAEERDKLRLPPRAAGPSAP